MAHLTNENWRPATICSANKAADFDHEVFVLPQHPRYQALADPVSVTGDSETWHGRTPLSSALNAFFRFKVSLPSGETSYAPPHGGMTIVVPAGQTRSVALPLWHGRAGWALCWDGSAGWARWPFA